LHSNPEARAKSGMSEAKVNEWLHSDKGSPWKRRDDGGGVEGGAPDMTNLYNTKLTPEQEAQFLRTPHRTTPGTMPGGVHAGMTGQSTGHGGDRFKKPSIRPSATRASTTARTATKVVGRHWTLRRSDGVTPSTNLRMRPPENSELLPGQGTGQPACPPQQERGGIVGCDEGGGITDPASGSAGA
jgi:hypothetical protein